MGRVAAPGVRLVLMTLTARHRRRALRPLVKKMADARERMQGRKPYQRLRAAAIVGTVAVREATHGAQMAGTPIITFSWSSGLTATQKR